ncbi:MAG: hypothetical protein ACLQAN_03190 [Acidimicrobiales bacterium]
MTPGLSLDLARAALLLRRAYVDEAKGRDPLPNFLASRAVTAPGDLSNALGLCVDALVRATSGDLDRLCAALWLDDDLAADLDAFAAGVSDPEALIEDEKNRP